MNQNGIVLDGHHRYKACQELGIEPKTLVKEFNSELDEQLFVIDCNLVRRQLNSFQRTELALKSKPILEAIVKRNESLGGKGGRNLTPLGRVEERIGERAGVSRDTVRKVEKILESKKLQAEVKDDLRLGKVSINGAYDEMVELDQEGKSLFLKCLKTADEMNKSFADIDDHPERINEKEERLKLIEKGMKNFKAYATYYFWVEYRGKKNSNIESVAVKTLKEIEGFGIADGMQMLPWQMIENILHHAVIENKINIDTIRNSSMIQDQLELLCRQQQEATGEKEPGAGQVL